MAIEMGERRAGEIGVDQRGRDAGARHAEPDRNVFGRLAIIRQIASPLPSPSARAQRA